MMMIIVIISHAHIMGTDAFFDGHQCLAYLLLWAGRGQH